MSYCLNPKCPKPDDESNAKRRICAQCGSDLFIQSRYRVIKKMGGGGFGQTFEILDQKDKTRKVLKVLLKEHPKAIALFKQEAKVLSELSHPGIPKVDKDGYFTFMPKDESPLHCLVMEKIEGLDLQEWMKERKKEPISPELAMDWLKQLVEILDRVHSLQYFHRDIKPQNIMRKPDGQLVLIDFGTAREVTETIMGFSSNGSGEQDNDKKRATGIVSPGYTPPEQTNGKAVPQSDFFALGRTFVYLLTGKPPTAYPENPRTGKLLWRKGAPNIPKQLADVLDYLMAPFPGNRPQNPGVVLQCLAEVELNPPPRDSDEREDPKSDTKGKKKEQLKAKIRLSELKIKIPFKAIGILSVIVTMGGLIYTQVDGYRRYGLIPANPMLVIRGWPNRMWLLGHKEALGHVYALAIAPDGETLVAGTFGTIRRWGIHSGEVVNPESVHSSWVRALAFSPNGEIMVSGSNDKTIRMWWGSRQRTIEGHTGSVHALVFSPNGQILASGSEDRTIILWDTNGRRLSTILAHDLPVNALAFNPQGNVLASASADASIRLWNVNVGDSSRRLTITGHGDSINAIAYSPDGETIASASDDGTVRLWNANTGEQLRVFEGHRGPVKSLVITPDGQTLIAGGDHIVLWNLNTGEIITTLWGHGDLITALALTPDGKILTSGSEDKTIKIWQLKL